MTHESPDIWLIISSGCVLWGCFWMRLKFELESWARNLPSPVWVDLIQSVKGALNRIKGWIRKNSFSLPEGFWAESLVFIGLLSFPRWCSGKQSVSLCPRHGLIPGLGRFLGAGNGNPPQYSCLENSMNRGAWQSTVHGVTKSWTWLSD